MKNIIFLMPLFLSVLISCSDIISGSFNERWSEIEFNSDFEAVEDEKRVLDADIFSYQSGDNSSSVTKGFILPVTGTFGTSISWSEKIDSYGIIVLSGDSGSNVSVSWNENCGFGPVAVTITATITKGEESDTKDVSFLIKPSDTQKIMINPDGVLFKMVLVLKNKMFPLGTADNGGVGIVDKDFWIGETEVTYNLWKRVRDWATHPDRGTNRYYFANQGIEGHNGTAGASSISQEPVTTVNWRDSMVWCNALTEWYNTNMGTNYICVYTYNGVIVRNSQDSNGAVCDAVTANSDADGFRLPMWREWELSARYRGSDTENTAVTVYASPAVNFGNPSDGIYWTKGNSVSGATKSYTDPASDNSIYAVYNVTSTADVKSKQPNALGLYDMSGNVKEWCFKYYGMFLILGGQWNINSDKMQVGEFDDNFSENEDYTTGFRLARNK